MMSETSLEDFMSALQSNTTNLWIQIFHVFLHTIDQHYLWRAKRCTARRHRIRREQHDGVQRARRVGSCSGCLLGCKYATVGEISLLPESCNTLPSSCYI
ncbi:hypothetical protein AAZX31_13G301000 [Glycine max]